MIILITGISSGFGKAMAERLSKDGHTVYGTYRKTDTFIQGVRYLKADVRYEESVRAAVAEILKEEGRIDLFINNAGMGTGGPLQFMTTDLAEEQMDVNFMGMIRFLKYILPGMTTRKKGRIICISSIAGLMGLPYQGLYSASKFALEGYCEALRIELRPFNIKVTVVNPGDFSTAFTSKRKKPDDAKIKTLYPGYMKSMQSIENDERRGLNPERLADKISKIVRKKHPAARYIIASPIQKMSVFIKKILPPRWFDRILSLYYKM